MCGGVDLLLLLPLLSTRAANERVRSKASTAGLGLPLASSNPLATFSSLLIRNIITGIKEAKINCLEAKGLQWAVASTEKTTRGDPLPLAIE